MTTGRLVEAVRGAQESLLHEGWTPEFGVGEFVRGQRRCGSNWTMGAIQVSVWEKVPGAAAPPVKWTRELTKATDLQEVEVLSAVLGGEFPPVGWAR